jgi:hypothetical protein
VVDRQLLHLPRRSRVRAVGAPVPERHHCQAASMIAVPLEAGAQVAHELLEP